MRNKLIAAVEEICVEKYTGAEIIFLAGSLVRGEGTATSDLDLVVMFRSLPRAYRESFRFKQWPVEAFVHDPDTLKYFFLEQDKPSGVPSLATMVSEGIEVPGPNEFSRSLKQLAESVLSDGPPLWNQDDIDRSRYTITSLADDLKEPRSAAESAASGAALFEVLATHYFRSRGLWSAKNKMIPRKLSETDPDFSERFVSSFADLFQAGNAQKVIKIAEDVLAPDEGWLFEGYTSFARREWRSA